MDKAHTYLCLIRIHGAFVEPVVIVLGALISGTRDFNFLLVLFLIGFMYHVYVYVLNEYADIEIDRKSSELQSKPLVSGIVPMGNALIISILGCISVFVLTVIFIPSISSIIYISLAVVLYGSYDLFGKRIPGFADFIGAGSYFFLFLFGVSTVSTQFTTIIYLVGLLIFFDVVFVNVVKGGLKDVDHDYLNGSKTLAIATGVNVKGEKLLITRKFKAFAYTIISICFVLVVLLFFQPEISLWYSDVIKLVILVPLAIVIAIPTYKLLHLRIFDRSKIKRLYALSDIGSGVLFFIILMPLLGVEIALFLILLPITWYAAFNIVLYGKPLQPGI